MINLYVNIVIVVLISAVAIYFVEKKFLKKIKNTTLRFMVGAMIFLFTLIGFKVSLYLLVTMELQLKTEQKS